MRTFDTGATRDSDTSKPDLEGFLSPLVLDEFARYMTKNRVQKDGNLRDSDNWQKGIPREAYMKSLWRHFMDLWRLHREYLAIKREIPGSFPMNDKMVESLCALYFNVGGYLHEVLVGRDAGVKKSDDDIIDEANAKMRGFFDLMTAVEPLVEAVIDRNRPDEFDAAVEANPQHQPRNRGIY